jgi:hypothetical protein
MRLLFILITCFAGLAVSGQGDAAFSKIRFAGYELSGGKQKIYFYSEIDPAGNFTVRVDFSDEPKTIRVKLADSTMQLLSSVLNGSDLQKLVESKEMKKGEHYSNSSYRYIQVEHGNRIQDLSFVRYLLAEQMRNLVIQLENVLDLEDQQEVKGSLIPGANFIKAMKESFKQSKHLPG